VNNDESNKPGSHWVCICFRGNNKVEYFDSYGIPPVKKSIITFLQRNAKYISFNNIQLQSFGSNICGQYCCLYALSKSHGGTMKKFLGHFNKKTFYENDRTCRNLFKKYFSTEHLCKPLLIKEKCKVI